MSKRLRDPDRGTEPRACHSGPAGSALPGLEQPAHAGPGSRPDHRDTRRADLPIQDTVFPLEIRLAHRVRDCKPANGGLQEAPKTDRLAESRSRKDGRAPGDLANSQG